MMEIRFVTNDDENDMIHVEHDGTEVFGDNARDAWSQYFLHVMPRGVPVLLTVNDEDARENDPRPYPDGESTDARLARWLRDNTENPDFRLDFDEDEDGATGNDGPVTVSRAELAFLVYCVAERFYWHGIEDVRERDGMR
jgi:hypothetical protein